VVVLLLLVVVSSVLQLHQKPATSVWLLGPALLLLGLLLGLLLPLVCCWAVPQGVAQQAWPAGHPASAGQSSQVGMTTLGHPVPS
jgi:hypothetical protein